MRLKVFSAFACYIAMQANAIKIMQDLEPATAQGTLPNLEDPMLTMLVESNSQSKKPQKSKQKKKDTTEKKETKNEESDENYTKDEKPKVDSDGDEIE